MSCTLSKKRLLSSELVESRTNVRLRQSVNTVTGNGEEWQYSRDALRAYIAAWASLAVAPARLMVGENDFEKNAIVCNVPFLSCWASHPPSATPEASHESTSGMLASNACSWTPSTSFPRTCSNAARSGPPKRHGMPLRVSLISGSMWCAKSGTKRRATPKMPMTCRICETLVGYWSRRRAAVFSSDSLVPSGEQRMPKNVTSRTRHCAFL